MKQAVALALIAVALLAYVSPRSVLAQPKPTEITPADGSILNGPPPVVHLCFSERPLHDQTDDFSFNALTPEGKRLGLRIVFDPLTTCVDVHLGLQGLGDASPLGQWTFQWEVIGEESGEPASGEVLYQVEEGGSPVPSPSPAAVATPRVGGTATSTPEAANGDADDGGLGAVWIAVIVAGAGVGALTLAGTVIFLWRRGQLGRRPPPAA